VREVKADCSRTETGVFVPSPVLAADAVTTTVTVFTGDGSPVPQLSGEMVSVSVETGQLYSMNVSIRYDLPSGPVFV